MSTLREELLDAIRDYGNAMQSDATSYEWGNRSNTAAPAWKEVERLVDSGALREPPAPTEVCQIHGTADWSPLGYCVQCAAGYEPRELKALDAALAEVYRIVGQHPENQWITTAAARAAFLKALGGLSRGALSAPPRLPSEIAVAAGLDAFDRHANVPERRELVRRILWAAYEKDSPGPKEGT